MNLIDELGNDLAIAFLVEKKYAKKISSEESLILIARIRETLDRTAPPETRKATASRAGFSEH